MIKLWGVGPLPEVVVHYLFAVFVYNYYLLTSLDVSSSLWYVISWSHLIVHSLSYLGYCRHLTHSSTVQQNYTLYNLCSSRVPRCSVILLGQCGCDVYVLYRCSYLVDIIQDDQIVGCGTFTLNGGSLFVCSFCI